MNDTERPDPIRQVHNTVEEAKLASKQADAFWAGKIEVGKAYLVALVLVVFLALAQLLPHSVGVRGFDVLFWTEAAQAQQTSLPSRIFVTLLSAGTILFGVVMIMTQRWWAAGIAWGTTCIAAVYGLLAIWLRQDGRGPDPDFTDFGKPAIGIYVSWVLVLALAVTYGILLWSKSQGQRDAEQAVREETRKYREAAEAERRNEEKMARYLSEEEGNDRDS